MLITIEIESGSGLAVAICSGVLGVQDARDSAEALWKTPGWSGRAVARDFREATFDVSPSGVAELAKFVRDQQPDPPPSRIAWAAFSDPGATRAT